MVKKAGVGVSAFGDVLTSSKSDPLWQGGLNCKRQQQ